MLTHSGLPKVYPRNRVKEQMWSKNLLTCHPEHGLHIRTAEVDVYDYKPHSSTLMSIALETTLIKHMAQEDKAARRN